jgi:predicted dehydrogenase
MGESTIRAAVLGTGFMAATHTGSLKALGATVTAVCDVTEALAESFIAGQELRARGFGDWEALLSWGEFDCLVVCIPPFAHAGQAEAAAGAGKHLFMEKPLAVTLERARRIVAACEGAGVVGQVGYQMRFLKTVRAAKERIASGKIGRPLHFQGRYWCRLEGKEWWKDRARSGGQVVEQLVHQYDLAAHFLGEPVSVTGRLANLVHGDDASYTVEDASLGLVDFAGGTTADISGSNAAVPQHFLGDWRLVCDGAAVELSTTGQHWVEPDRGRILTEAGAEEFVEDGNPYLEEMREFLGAVEAGRPSAVPLREGLTSLTLAKCVQVSAERGGARVGYGECGEG